MNFEQQYAEIIDYTMRTGKIAEGRNGRTISTFAHSLEIDMTKGKYFPLLLGRKIFYKSVFGELAAFFNGPKNVKDFENNGCYYWGQWADDVDGNIELDYGNAWTNYNDVNQLDDVIHQLGTTPHSRRILINSWRADRVITGQLSLPCCHYAYQWYVTADNHLDMIWIQRSVDLMIGLPSDIVLAAAWNVLLAQLTNYKPGKITMQLGDCHVYEEHLMNANKYLQNVRNIDRGYPTYWVKNTIEHYTDFHNESIIIEHYSPMEVLKFELKS